MDERDSKKKKLKIFIIPQNLIPWMTMNPLIHRAIVQRKKKNPRREKERIKKKLIKSAIGWKCLVGNTSSFLFQPPLVIDANSESQRQRQFQIVDDNSDEEGNESDKDSESSSISEQKRKKSKKDRKKKESSSSKYESDTDSSNEHESKKSKKSKKKKSKKEKKSHKKHKSDRTAVKTAVDQNEFGKYGIVRIEDYYAKQREFEAYMLEVKNMPGVLSAGRGEIMKYFKDFIEDFNTATMPHEKFYNYERWEIMDYERKKREKSSGDTSEFNDEDERKQEIKRMRDEMELKKFNALKKTMASDKSLRDGMRRQEALKSELQLAYKQGDETEKARLERLLAPDEECAAVKHPWA